MLGNFDKADGLCVMSSSTKAIEFWMHFLVNLFSITKPWKDATGGGKIEAIRENWIRPKADQQLVHKSEEKALETY